MIAQFWINSFVILGGPTCSDNYVTLEIRNEVRELPKEIKVEEYKMQNHWEETEVNWCVVVISWAERYVF